MIKVNNLTRQYGNFTAVNRISFDIPKGQIVGLLGPNGAGKTTTLKMLTGFLEATSGTINIAGMDIREKRFEIQKKIGYLPEASPLYPEMPVIHYLDYVADIRHLSGSAKNKAIQQVIKQTGLEDKIYSDIWTLSKGYKQRVGVAQAILHNPEILILDEPTSGLDPTQIQEMRDLIKKIGKTSTVIISTHILQEVEAVCDRVIIINNGKIAADANLDDLQKTNRIILNIDKEPSAAENVLSQIKGIKKVTDISSETPPFSYILEAEDNTESIIPEIARLTVNQGWKLFSLNKEHRDIETVFREVNKIAMGGEKNEE